MDNSRPLTPGECALAESVFGRAVDLGRVRINRRRWWPFQPRRIVMAPDGQIWFHPDNPDWRDDFAEASIGLQGLLIHELTHVWQTQRGIYLPLARHPFCRYHYRFTPGWPLHRYGIEQQAEIVRHAFLLREGIAVAGAPPLDRYLSVLPFPIARRPDGRPMV
jgi:hypothetical protein